MKISNAANALASNFVVIDPSLNSTSSDGPRPIKNRHEIVTDGIDATMSEISHRAFVVLNELMVVTFALLDCFVNRQALRDRPFSPSDSISRLLFMISSDGPDFADRNVVECRHNTRRTCLLHLLESNRDLPDRTISMSVLVSLILILLQCSSDALQCNMHFFSKHANSSVGWSRLHSHQWLWCHASQNTLSVGNGSSGKMVGRAAIMSSGESLRRMDA